MATAVQERVFDRGNAAPIAQYDVTRILLIWAAAALPMGILGWVVAPALSRDSANPILARMAPLTAGLAWQAALVAWLVYREAGTSSWSIAARRLWLRTPIQPRTGQPSRRLWWWLVPFVLLTAVYDLVFRGAIDRVWVSAFPWLAEPQGFALGAALATPEARAQLIGAWGFFVLFLTNALLNTFVGEELLFRGLLLPRMSGAFGRFDWLANGVLFGLYHLHQPWGMFSSALTGVLFFALPSRHFQSAWFGVIAHSGQSIFFAVLILGLVLGLM